MAYKKATIESTDIAIARWKTRLARAMTHIRKLELQRKRLVRAEAKKAAEKAAEPAPVEQHAAYLRDRYGLPAPSAAKPEPVIPAHVPTVPAPPVPDLDIPGFLRRSGPSDADVAAAEAIKAEQEALKKAKAQGRFATIRAKKSGETKKMPLTGKAALDLINSEE